MAGKIPREFIDHLIARIDLVDLIDARVPLKKTGANYQARCPFHTEKTPSFSVSRDKQFYHCFGCGAHGNAIGFLMDYERQTFVEAIETLADTLGIPVPREADAPEALASLSPLYDILAQAAAFYARQLREHPQAQRAVDYLKARGLSGAIAKRFQLGYAPPGWSNLPSELPQDLLSNAGLLASNDSGQTYERFRDRVIFPIRDRRGRVVGLGGRVLGDDKPKYLNSPETAVFKKHQEVYGLHELLETLRKPERILVVEGYMDVIALAQHGIPYAVATLGTATSADHAVLLFRYARELVFCFDGDNAGRNAAWKALEASLPALREGRALRFLLLPEAHDPDSLVRAEGCEAFERRVADALPLSDYFFQQLEARHGPRSLESRAALMREAAPLVDKIPPGVFRNLMQSRLEQIAGHSAAEILAKPARPQGHRRPLDSERARPSTLRTILALLIQNPGFFAMIDPESRQALVQEAKAGSLARKLFAYLDENPGVHSGGLQEWFRDAPEAGQIKQLSVWEILVPEDGAAAEFAGALAQYRKQCREKRLEALLGQQARMGLSAEEKQEIQHLLRERISK
jgi:DNA primase